MKSSFLVLRYVLIIFLLFIISSVLFPQDQKPYGFKTAHVKKTGYTKSTGVTVEKTEDIYISDYGKKVTSFITEKRKISMAGQNINEETRSVTINDGEFLITYDPDKKTGTKIKNTFSDKFSGMSEDQMKKFAEQMGDAMNTKVNEEGTEVVAGLTCIKNTAITDMMGMKTTTTTWNYKNYIVQLISKGTSTDIKETVTEFNEGVNIDPNVHKVPEDINITTMNSPY